MKNAAKTIAVLSVFPLLLGCHQHLFSPPARPVQMESARPANPQRSSLTASASAYDEILGFSANAVSVSARQGLNDRTEAGVDLTAISIDDSNAATDVDPRIWGGRLGVKSTVGSTIDYVAFTFGIGGGISAGGTFISPDLGVIFAYQNDTVVFPFLPFDFHVVPFVSIDGYYSIPIEARPVDMSSEGQGPGTEVATPRPTLGSSLSLGGEGLLVFDWVTVAPYAGVSLTVMTDWRDDSEAFGARAGLKFELN